MKKILLVLLLTLPLSVQGKIYAIFVGVSEYELPIDNLVYSHRDAIEMYELMKEHTAPDRVKLLINDQAKYDSIVSYTAQLFRRANPDDVVLFFFSGRGQGNAFYANDKILYLSKLNEIFKQTKARRKLIFADACYSGTLSGESDNQAVPDGSKGLDSNVLLYLSSRSDQYATGSTSFRNGVFTYFLLTGLRGGADANKNGSITAKELYDYVNPKVKERTNGKQIPSMRGKFDTGMVILKLKGK